MKFLYHNKMTIFLLTMTLLMALSSLYFFFSHKSDMDNFRLIIKQEIKSTPGTGLFIKELNEWIYFNKGFAKNKHYFLFQSFGPTPKQVLTYGGDCSDKSRLLATMLAAVNIDSTLVMLYGCETCNATHTVVNTYYNDGETMVADPVFNIIFPKKETGYFNIKELKDDPSILPKQLNLLIKERGNYDKITRYLRDTESYSWVKTINWNKNFITQKIGDIIGLYVDDPFLVMRPQFLEDPKLLYTYITSIFTLFIFLLFLISLRDNNFNIN